MFDRRCQVIVVTSCNFRQWQARGEKEWLPSFLRTGIPLKVYHEGFPVQPAPQAGVEWIDLFQADPGILKIVSDPRFNQARSCRTRNQRYYNYHAQFWFRKVAAVNHACKAHPNEIVVWTDIDVKPRRFFRQEVIGRMCNAYDVWRIDRHAMRQKVTDTGFLVFSPAAHSVVKEWYRMYSSGDVFELPFWADHFCLDHVVEKMKPKVGALPLPLKGHGSLVYHSLGHVEMAGLRKPV